MGQQSNLPGPPSYLVGESSLFKSRSGIPDTGMKLARERAGDFVRLINGQCVLLTETAGDVMRCAFWSARGLRREVSHPPLIFRTGLTSTRQQLLII